MDKVFEQYFGFIGQDLKAGTVIVLGCLLLVVLSCLIDLWSGVTSARARGERVRSHPLRATGAKMLDYFCLDLFFMLIDLLGLVFPWWGIPYATVCCTLAVMLTEGLSVVENLRKKRSHAAEAASLVEDIVGCVTPEKARELLERLLAHAAEKAPGKKEGKG